MRTGIGLPAAVPGTPGAMVGEWAAEAERLGFASVSVIDRLVYDTSTRWWRSAPPRARSGSS